MLERMGLNVLDERPHRVVPPGMPPVWMHDFGMQSGLRRYRGRDRYRAPGVRGGVRQRSSGARSRTTTSIAWCWRRVFLRPKSSCSAPTRNICARSGFRCRSLSSNRRSPRTRRSRTALIELFKTRFDPELGAGTGARSAELVRAIEDALAQVDNLSEDRVLAPIPGAGDGHDAHEFLAPRRRRPAQGLRLVQVRPGQGARIAGAEADVRDIRLFAAVRGRAPARRQGRPRRLALVRSAGGLPHRGAGAGQGADGQEHGHRAGRFQRRLRAQARAAARRSRRLSEGRHRLLPGLSARAARHHRQPGGRRHRAAARGEAARPGRPVSGRRRGQRHGDVLRLRQCDQQGIRLLAGRRFRVRRIGGLRPQGDGDHRARRLGIGQAAFPGNGHRHADDRLYRRRHRRHVGRRIRQRHAALASHQAGRGLRSSPCLSRSRRPTRPAALPSANGCSSCRARRGPTTTPA